MSNPIVERVRQSLGRTAGSPVGPRPAIPGARQPETVDGEIERFLKELQLLSATGQRLSPDGAAGALAALVSERKIHKAAAWDTPLIQRLQVREHLQALGVELVPADADKQLLAQCDLGMTEADFILPETGTLGLRSSVEKPRAVSLLPFVHLAIVSPAALRADLHQVFAEAGRDPYLVLITGPSRTSDIELTPTLGMHGPRYLYVFVVE